MPKTWFKISPPTPANPDQAEALIYDTIGAYGVAAGEFVEQLNALKASKITIKINSDGGEIFGGMAIANAIKAHPAEITTRVDGLAASIASVIAISGKRVVMSKNAFMMIHNAWAAVKGDADDIRKEAETLDKLTESIAQSYADKTHRPLAEVKAAMDSEKWFDASEAQAWGLVDEVNGRGAISARAIKAITESTSSPESLKRFVAQAKRPHRSKPMAKLEAYVKDGMCYVNTEGMDPGEYELKLPAEAMPGDDGDSDEQGKKKNQLTKAAPVATLTQADIDKAIAEDRENQRKYLGEFRAALTTSGLTGKDAETFEKDFFGKPIEDVKRLASFALGLRAKPVGEAGGAADGADALTDEQKAEKQLEKDAAERFARGDSYIRGDQLRKRWGVLTADQNSDEYKRGLAEYVASEKKWAADRRAESAKRVRG